MSDRFENPPSADSYIAAAFCGLLAGIGVAAALVFVVIFGVSLGEAEPQSIGWSALGLVMVVVLAAIPGLIVGTPIAFLFVAIMTFAERAHPIARTLPVWLLGGLIAGTPLFGWMWYLMQGPGDAVPSLGAAIAPLIVVYGASVAAAATAWRMRYRSGL